METKFCQSCGMPLQKNEELGTNHDGSKNEEYCCYCYKDFHYTKEEAEANIKLFFPTLKRWAVQ